jgi:hypothetical protein
MDSPAITSAAQAVHQELVRELGVQTRIDGLRDQYRRARTQPDPGSWLAPAASRPFAAGFSGESPVPPVPPVPGGPTGLTGPGATVTLNPPAPPA